MVQRKLSKEITDKIAEFRSAIERDGITVDDMIVFGSYAKGNERPDSDIDVCIVSGMFGHDDVQEMQDMFRKSVMIDTRIEPYPVAQNYFQDLSNPLAYQIHTYGVSV
jgi:predicted nucleotidyltransferase